MFMYFLYMCITVLPFWRNKDKRIIIIINNSVTTFPRKFRDITRMERKDVQAQ